jgi:hypothetical protein
MSSATQGAKPCRRKPKGSGATDIGAGLVGPKPRACAPQAMDTRSTVLDHPPGDDRRGGRLWGDRAWRWSSHVAGPSGDRGKSRSGTQGPGARLGVTLAEAVRAGGREKPRREPVGARTANRHRWAPVKAGRRSGEPSLRNSANWPRNFGRRGARPKRAAGTGPRDCLPKTQVRAQAARRSIRADACPVSEG